MKKKLFSSALIALGIALSGRVYAECGSPGAARLTPNSRLLSSLSARVQAPDHWNALDTTAPPADPSIVGLWDVEFFDSTNTLYDEGYDVFHSDGTEMMNDFPNPANGNVCLGVYVKTAPQTYHVHHVYWNWDNEGNVNGRGVLEETLTIATSGSTYSGSFTFTNYDLDGTKLTTGPLAPISGSLKANRISVQAPPVTAAIAGPKNGTTILRQFALDGSASTSADGQPLTYFWDIAQGSLPAWISRGNTATPTVGFNGGDGTYTFTLTVTDSAGKVATDSVAINFYGR